MKNNFKLPNTQFCLVVWYRNNRSQPKVLLNTPPNNEMLRMHMLEHGVGYGEIRAVQPVKQEDLTAAMLPKFRRA